PASAARTSRSGSGAALTMTTRPSSSARPSPFLRATASGRSSRNSSPRRPFICTRRRCLPSKSSATVSVLSTFHEPAGRTRVARIIRPGCSADIRFGRPGEEGPVEGLHDRVRRHLRKRSRGKSGVVDRLVNGKPIGIGQNLRWESTKAGAHFDGGRDHVALIVDGHAPAILPLLRLKFPLEKMLKEHLQPTAYLALFRPPHAFNLLGDILPVDAVRPRFTQPRRLVLRPSVEIGLVGRGRPVAGFRVAHAGKSRTLPAAGLCRAAWRSAASSSTRTARSSISRRRGGRFIGCWRSTMPAATPPGPKRCWSPAGSTAPPAG